MLAERHRGAAVPRWPPQPRLPGQTRAAAGSAVCAPAPARPHPHNRPFCPCPALLTRGRRCLGRSIISTAACPIPSLCTPSRAALPHLTHSIPKSPAPTGISGGMCSGHRRGNSPVWLAGTRFLPDLCCQSHWKLACSGVIIAGEFWCKQQKLVGSRPGLLVAVHPCWEQPAAPQTHSRAKGISILVCTRQPPLDTSSLPPPFISSLGQRFVP